MLWSVSLYQIFNNFCAQTADNRHEDNDITNTSNAVV